MIVPDKEQFLRQAEEGTLIPVFREFYADLETPVSAYLKISARFPTDHFLLESVEGGEKWARYSFIGFDPHLRFRADAKGITVRQGGETRNVPVAGDPLDALAAILKEIRYRPAPGLPRLSGGAVGYIGYDYVRYLEKVGGDRPLTDAPDAMFLFPSRLLIFDNVRHTILIVAHGSVHAGEDPDAVYARALEAIEEVRGILRVPLEGSEVPDGDDGGDPPAFEMPRGAFLDAVRKAKEHIRNGDIIQAVLSNRATVRTRRTPAEVYRVLRALNPSPYMYLLRMGDLSVVGSSPEILVRLEGDEIQLRPIAGTRPRGATPSEDRRLEAELLSDPKELAEHVMLVDLGRNDVGRVAAWGSVKADELMGIERYSHVMHIVSNVVGKLREGLTAFDVLRAAFPAGTVSGAPKVRAMQIISELEPFRRGIYAGAVGYFDLQGSMDFCIAIRTIVMSGGEAMIQAGAGIVADSDPAREWDEILNKARILFRAVGVSPETLEAP
ncbi:MAG: anthranilate synthase component I [Deltaproteobacteria bacterium]|uniref:anthranilate synthase component I n=1 Tax=Candidatus Deferrimicrobium sp. TaxID=3060586 RepID=UPI00271B876E|nr:anthranilate synthase component I [Candidatus Deferrimicrobium sp.]MCR4310524.1 anthranilate synthase component I [Deltaproteobacteria bacterium]MDO8738154.1 anthranilate synthase component I [Candidatus Deferrimicrobium sp.]